MKKIELASILGLLFCSFAWSAPRVIDAIPQGKVRDVRQIRVQFSDPVQPFGVVQSPEVPYQVDCRFSLGVIVKGQGRFIDPKNWVYEFESELPPGVECTVRPNAAFQTMNREKLSGATVFAFNTGGPSITSISPYASSIDPDFAILVESDLPLDAQSITSNTWLEAEGLSDRIRLEKQSDSLRDRVLISQRGKKFLESSKNSLDRFLLLKAARPLALNSKFSWTTTPEVRSKNGLPLENPQKYDYKTYEPFVWSVSCERALENAPCVPFTSITVSSNRPFDSSIRDQVYLETKTGQKIRPKVDQSSDEIYAIQFQGPFDQKSEYKIRIPKSVKDLDGNELSNAKEFPVTLKTSEYPPLAKFPSTFGLYEAQGEPKLPIDIRSIAENGKRRSFKVRIKHWPEVSPDLFRNLQNKTGQQDQVPWGSTPIDARTVSILAKESLVEVMEIQATIADGSIETAGIPLKRGSGVYLVEVESARLGQALTANRKPVFVSALAVVTPFGVHTKWSREGAFVWVTDLAQGKPVSGANIELLDCAGKSLGTGMTASDGTAKILGAIQPGNCSGEIYRYQSGFFVKARKGDDVAFTHSDWNDGIEPWRFRLSSYGSTEDRRFHALLDRTWLRLGDTLHVKFLAREIGSRGFQFLKSDELPTRAIFKTVSGKQAASFPLKWNEGAGTAIVEWKVPQESFQGDHTVDLEFGTGKKTTKTVSVGSFLIGDYRIPKFSARVQFPSTDPSGSVRLENGKVPLEFNLQYLNGGVARGIPIKVHAEWSGASSTELPNQEGLSFNLGDVKTGTTKRSNHYWEDEEETESKKVLALNESRKLDDTGNFRVELVPPSSLDVSSYRLSVQFEFKDPNGEVQTVNRYASVSKTQEFISVRANRTDAGDQEALTEIESVVADTSGNPVAGKEVTISWIREDNISHRRKIVGGFYEYESQLERSSMGDICTGKTDKLGKLRCNVTPKMTGSYRVIARAKDPSGETIASNDSFWIYLTGRAWFSSSNSDRIDIIPDKKEYAVGEKAKFQIQMPFDTATVLITTEREGVRKSFVKTIDSRKPEFEVELTESDVPNILVSALAIRGRIAVPNDKREIDLGKPAFRMGLAQVSVGKVEHELKTRVETDKKVYGVREEVKAQVIVDIPAGVKPDWNRMEAAVFVVDEGLLSLRANDSIHPLSTFLAPKGHEVQTATSMLQLVGKRHFGLKARPTGGGGGAAITRELFDTLIYWNASVRLKKGRDGKAEGEFRFKTNDSLSAFRIVAVVTEGVSRFGTGHSIYQTEQPFSILAGIPNQIREGENLVSEWTLRNSTSTEKKVVFELKPSWRTPIRKTVTIAARGSERITESLPFPESATASLAIEGTLLDAGNNQVYDRASFKPKLESIERWSVLQGKVGTIQGTVTEPISAGHRVQVALQRTFLPDLSGAREYMKTYPYSCFEQKLSKSVVLNQESFWNETWTKANPYFDHNDLLRFFPDSRMGGSDFINQYALTLAKRTGWKIPAETRSRVISGLTTYALGKAAPEYYKSGDTVLRQLSALRALFEAQAWSGELEEKLLSLDLPIILMPAATLADLLTIDTPALRMNPKWAQVKNQAIQQLKTRVEFQGSKMALRTPSQENLPSSYLSEDYAVLKIFEWMKSDPKSAGNGDEERFLRGISDRMKSGRMDTTIANAYAVALFERKLGGRANAVVTGDTTLAYGKTRRVHTWKKDENGELDLSERDVAADGMMELSHRGEGKPVYQMKVLTNAFPTEARHHGMKLDVQYREGEGTSAVRDWKAERNYTAEVTIDSPVSGSWLAVQIPLPTGATLLGTEAVSGSEISFAENRGNQWVGYYEYYDQGKTTFKLRFRLNQAGKFVIPPARAEAMYSPDVFSELPLAKIEVKE